MDRRTLANHLANQIGVDSSARRRVLGAIWAVAAAGLVAPVRKTFGQVRFGADPFTLGIASGCPRPDGFVLWTRLAPEPLAGGGVEAASVTVQWEVANDRKFHTIARKGVSETSAASAHSVHVALDGLRPDRAYFYRFMAGGATSPVGYTRTAPEPAAEVQRLRFAIASCQQYEQGFYAAYRHMAQDDVDLVVHLGDYIYESSWGRQHVRTHTGGEPITLEEYRNRHAQYKTDPDLQRMHAAAPWLLTWDDHEVENDYANDRSQRLDPNFLLRRAAAYQAYYEHMPLAPPSRPSGPNMRLFDRYTFGRLVQFHVLDDRQYRSHQACPRPDRGGSNVVEDCAERLDPARTMLGDEQERWLHEALARSTARWNVLAQQTVMGQIDQKPGPGARFWTDGWDGYPAARRRLLEHIGARKPSNPLVVGGDVHMNYVCDLKPDFDDSRSPVVATEFCGTSITSQSWPQKRVDSLRPDNPHLRFADSRKRGYVLIELGAKRATAWLRGLDNEKQADSGIGTQASFIVEDGRPGAQRA